MPRTTPTDPAFAAWIATGRALMAARDAATWAFADWIAEGRQHPDFDASTPTVARQLGTTGPRLRALAIVAEAFAPAHRAHGTPFDVAAHLARLPADRRADAMAQAAAERWGERQARVVHVAYKQEVAVFEDDDTENRLAVEIMRAWNRAPPESRQYFAELAQTAGLGIIDEDAVSV